MLGELFERNFWPSYLEGMRINVMFTTTSIVKKKGDSKMFGCCHDLYFGMSLLKMSSLRYHIF